MYNEMQNFFHTKNTTYSKKNTILQHAVNNAKLKTKSIFCMTTLFTP